jgi:hypothetical protein
MTGTPNGHFYDPAPIVGDVAMDLSPLERMQLAEDLSGSIKLHVVYAAKAGEAEGRVARRVPAWSPSARRGPAGAGAGGGEDGPRAGDIGAGQDPYRGAERPRPGDRAR